MGSLWIAFDRRLRRKVAIKFINATSASLEEAHTRFDREARAAAQIRSPHVVHTYDYGADRGHPYIVMELLEGEDLGVRLVREGRIAVDTVAKILGQMAKGLDAVHASGIIHRDLKPANVFVALIAGEETIKLIDFGVARTDQKDGQRTTGRGAMLGTVKYMAPEQALGEKTLDRRADLWSLAVIVYRLLTGKYPFNGASLEDLVSSICEEPFQPPSEHVAGLPPGVDAFFTRALSRDADGRFQSAQQMSASFFTAVTSERNGTLPWGTRASTRQIESARAEVKEEKAHAHAAVESAAEELEPYIPSRESQDETRIMPDALPPPRPILPSNFTPSPSSSQRSRQSASARSRWWLASIPAAAVVVAGAVVFGVTGGKSTSNVTAPRPAECAREASAANPPSPSPGCATGR